MKTYNKLCIKYNVSDMNFQITLTRWEDIFEIFSKWNEEDEAPSSLCKGILFAKVFLPWEEGAKNHNDNNYHSDSECDLAQNVLWTLKIVTQYYTLVNKSVSHRDRG